MQRAAVAIAMACGILVAVKGAAAEVPAFLQGAPESVPRAVTVARSTAMPQCASFVDAAAPGEGAGTAQQPYKTIAAAVEAAQPGAVICVAEGVYAEELRPGEKHFTLAGGFQSGSGFTVRDSAAYVSKAQGSGGGSFLRYEDTLAPVKLLTAVDGFEITGYSQAIFRDYWEPQTFEVTNNYIHDNVCDDQTKAGGGVALINVSGSIKGNVFKNNACGRGGAVFLHVAANENEVTLANNYVEGNAGTEPDSSHGGAFYLFGYKLNVVGNLFIGNSVTKWGGGLFIGAYTAGGEFTTASVSWNVYRANRAGSSGGGFFCDDGATCHASHEVYERNCGGNILVDGGAEGSGPTTATFDHITNVGALDVDCATPGVGFLVDSHEALQADTYEISNSIFWGNAPGKDFATGCSSGCDKIKVSVSRSLAETRYEDGNIKIAFGDGMVTPADPKFLAPDNGDFRLEPGSPGTGLGAYGGVDQAALAASPAVAAAPPAAPSPPPPAASPSPAPVPAAPDPASPAPAHAAQVAAPPSKPAVDAAAEGISAKEAFAAAKDLNTVEGWQLFLDSYPTGFYAEIARGFLKKLGAAEEPAARYAPEAAPRPKTAAEEPASQPASAPDASRPPPVVPRQPAIERGASYMGFPERFNRYYTDPFWLPTRVVYVSPQGGGDGSVRETPTTAKEAITQATPGTKVHFLPGEYEGCFEIEKDNGGTYDDPIVLYAERNADQSIGVSMTCCKSGRQTCFNLEGANYIAIDGFELIGGNYGVRVVGMDYPASQHSRGAAVLGCLGHDQERDPFKSSNADWVVWERNIGHGAKKGDGHGIYISNGSDWNIVRFNETYGNASSDFQINADPISTCAEAGVAYDDPRCDAYAGEGEGGQGASDYILVDGNHFHSSEVGANFTSVRRSIIRNNIFGPQRRHNVSFWQETDNPKLGSSDNKILHNLFITTRQHGIKFEAGSTRNAFINNVIIGLTLDGGKAAANPKALLMEVDDTVGDNVYRDNLYISGHLMGREPNGEEMVREDFDPGWFERFPTTVGQDADGFSPAAGSPLLDKGKLLSDAPADRGGRVRAGAVDLGPIEAR